MEACYFCGDPQWEWPRYCVRCKAACCACCSDMDGLCPECSEQPDMEDDYEPANRDADGA